MTQYLVTVATPMHGELLHVIATPATFLEVIKAATAIVNSIAVECARAHAPINFRVDVKV